ncbi:MAG TPA: DMT family transporter [Rhizomicrobium sp.]|nr:DMT family transporter [Rhizomicrobium sp.]
MKIGATLSFSMMYVAIRLAGPVPLGEVVFFRGLFAIAPLIAVSFFTHGPASLVRTSHPLLHIRRSMTGAVGMFLNFGALTRLPLADVTAFSFVMPIFATILAALLLGEKVGPHRTIAVAAGFAGVIFMAEPNGLLRGLTSIPSSGVAMALAAALCSAVVVVFIRQMSATETSEAIVFYFMVVCAILGAVSMLWDFAPLSPTSAAWLILCGLFGGVGQVCMTYSYRYAEPSLLAPFDYVAMVWAIFLGYFVFFEVPEPTVLAGAGAVIASGLYIVFRERRSHRLPAADAGVL